MQIMCQITLAKQREKHGTPTSSWCSVRHGEGIMRTTDEDNIGTCFRHQLRRSLLSTRQTILELSSLLVVRNTSLKHVSSQSAELVCTGRGHLLVHEMAVPLSGVHG